jgi:hypothetical protein
LNSKDGACVTGAACEIQNVDQLTFVVGLASQDHWNSRRRPLIRMIFPIALSEGTNNVGHKDRKIAFA